MASVSVSVPPAMNDFGRHSSIDSVSSSCSIASDLQRPIYTANQRSENQPMKTVIKNISAVKVPTLDVLHLTQSERDLIMSVLRKDDELRHMNDKAIYQLRAELHSMRLRLARLKQRPRPPDSVCDRCDRRLKQDHGVWIWRKLGEKVLICPRCSAKTCSSCQIDVGNLIGVSQLHSGTEQKKWLCVLCTKEVEMDVHMGTWLHNWWNQKNVVPSVGVPPSIVIRASINKAFLHDAGGEACKRNENGKNSMEGMADGKYLANAGKQIHLQENIDNLADASDGEDSSFQMLEDSREKIGLRKRKSTLADTERKTSQQISGDPERDTSPFKRHFWRHKHTGQDSVDDFDINAMEASSSCSMQKSTYWDYSATTARRQSDSQIASNGCLTDDPTSDKSSMLCSADLNAAMSVHAASKYDVMSKRPNASGSAFSIPLLMVTDTNTDSVTSSVQGKSSDSELSDGSNIDQLVAETHRENEENERKKKKKKKSSLPGSSFNFNSSSSKELSRSSESINSFYSNGESIGDVRDDLEIKGMIQLGFHYDCGDQVLQVIVKRAADLAVANTKKNKSNPYVKVYLTSGKGPKVRKKTSVKRGCLNPVYEETLSFPLVSRDDLETKHLRITVWHHESFVKNIFLGEMRFIFPEGSWGVLQEEWFPLRNKLQEGDQCTKLITEEGQAKDIGYLRFSLRWTPDMIKERKRKSLPETTLELEVKECISLKNSKGGTPPNAFIRALLLPETQHNVLPTSKRKASLNSNRDIHTFDFHSSWNLGIPGITNAFSERSLEISVHEHADNFWTPSSVMGCVRLNLGTGILRDKPVHWMDATGDEIEAWRSLQDHPGVWIDTVLPLRHAHK